MLVFIAMVRHLYPLCLINSLAPFVCLSDSLPSSPSGVHLIERSKSRQILKQFTLRELDRWGYKPGILFYFEVKLDRKETTSIEFGTRDGLKMANLLTDYAHALIQEVELQKVSRMSLHVQRDLDADERNFLRLSTNASSLKSQNKNQSSVATGAPVPPPPPPPPPPPSKRNSLPNGIPLLPVEKSSPRAHRASFSATATPPPPPPKKPIVPAGSLAPQRLPGFGALAPETRLSARGSPTVPPPPPPPPKSSNRPSHRPEIPSQIQPPPYHHQCATIIQSNYRGYALRSSWIKEDAAILIQSVYRGYAERCRVAVLLEEMYRSGQLELLDEES
jgi:hypothetical protein